MKTISKPIIFLALILVCLITQGKSRLVKSSQDNQQFGRSKSEYPTTNDYYTMAFRISAEMGKSELSKQLTAHLIKLGHDKISDATSRVFRKYFPVMDDHYVQQTSCYLGVMSRNTISESRINEYPDEYIHILRENKYVAQFLDGLSGSNCTHIQV